MARLYVEASPRWVGPPSFETSPLVVVISVTNDVGEPVNGLPRDAVTVHYQDGSGIDSAASSISSFHELGGHGQRGYYLLVVQPGGEAPSQSFLHDEVLLYVTVRHAGNHGQTVCVAQFNGRSADTLATMDALERLHGDVNDLKDRLATLDTRTAQIENELRGVTRLVHTPSGATLGNILENVRDMTKKIKHKVVDSPL